MKWFTFVAAAFVWWTAVFTEVAAAEEAVAKQAVAGAAMAGNAGAEGAAAEGAGAGEAVTEGTATRDTAAEGAEAGNAAAEDAATKAATDVVRVKFFRELSEDKRSSIPAVGVQTINRHNGTPTNEKFLFPEVATTIAPEAEDYYRGSRTAQEQFYVRVQYGDHIVDTPAGLKAYSVQIEQYADKDKASTLTRATRFLLYEFDLQTKRLRVLSDVESEARLTKKLDLLLPYNGYAVYPEDTGTRKYNEPGQYWVYSLETNELLAELPYAPHRPLSVHEPSFRLDPQPDPYALKYTEYVPGPLPNQQLSVHYQVFADGSVAHTPENKRYATFQWRQSAGGREFVKYWDSGLRQWFIGVVENGKYRPLSDVGTNARAYFSPEGTYMIMKQYAKNADSGNPSFDPYLTVYHIQQDAVLYSIPQFETSEGPSAFFIDETLAKLQFNGGSYFLHLPTGIVTLEDRRIHDATKQWSASYDGLFTPLAPAEVIVDGRVVEYSGQGAFPLYDGTWYVPVDDFARTAGLEQSYDALSNAITLKRGDFATIVRLEDPRTILVRDRVYAPLFRMSQELGYIAAQTISSSPVSDMEHNRLSLFDPAITEREFLATYPDTKTYPIKVAPYVAEDWTLYEVQGDFSQYWLYDTFQFSFQADKLASVRLRSSWELLEFINEGVSVPVSQLAGFYGPAEPIPLEGGRTMYVYYEPHFIRAFIYSNYLEAIHIIPRKRSGSD